MEWESEGFNTQIGQGISITSSVPLARIRCVLRIVLMVIGLARHTNFVDLMNPEEMHVLSLSLSLSLRDGYSTSNMNFFLTQSKNVNFPSRRQACRLTQ